MRFRKEYGQSKVLQCPFCERQATTQNKQKVPVCRDHKEQMLSEITCVCGSTLELREGKYGSFFTCINCGALSFRKGLDIMQMTRDSVQPKKEIAKEIVVKKPEVLGNKRPFERKEIVVRSDELDFM